LHSIKKLILTYIKTGSTSTILDDPFVSGIIKHQQVINFIGKPNC